MRPEQGHAVAGLGHPKNRGQARHEGQRLGPAALFALQIKAKGEAAAGGCAEWRGANRRCRRQQAPDGSKARPRNVPTSRPLINQGGEGEGSFPASVFTEHLSCAAPEREGFAELVKEGSCARQRGGRTIWRGKKRKGDTENGKLCKSGGERLRRKGGREAGRRRGMGGREGSPDLGDTSRAGCRDRSFPRSVGQPSVAPRGCHWCPQGGHCHGVLAALALGSSPTEGQLASPAVPVPTRGMPRPWRGSKRGSAVTDVAQVSPGPLVLWQ